MNRVNKDERRRFAMSNLIPFGQSAQQTTNRNKTKYISKIYIVNPSNWEHVIVSIHREDQTGLRSFRQFNHLTWESQKRLFKAINEAVESENAIITIEFGETTFELVVTFAPPDPDKVAYKVSPSGNNGGLLPWQQWADFPYPIISGVA